MVMNSVVLFTRGYKFEGSFNVPIEWLCGIILDEIWHGVI